MDRTWLLPRLLPACVVALGACAGDIGNEGKTQDGAETQDTYEPGRFPSQADLIDDIRCQLTGECATGGTPPVGGTPVGSGGSTSAGIPQHGDPPLGGPSDSHGPYAYDSYEGSTGQIYYPTNAASPFAGMSLCGGFLNSGVEMLSWGEFYASWGIVTEVTWTGIFDDPDSRGWALGTSIEELKAENGNPSSPIYQKMSGRYGTSGYSMGGGGTTVASQADPSLKSSIGMAPWTPTGLGVQVPSIFICGDVDFIAGCDHSEWAYGEVSGSVPKMLALISGGHLDWFGPDAGYGAGGGLGLAFAKVFLEGDERWKSALLGMSNVTETNIY